MRRFLTRLAALARNSRSGVAAVEFAVIAPVLTVLLAGATNIGLAVDHSIQLANAARAGAQFATVQQDNMAGARTAALNMMPGATVATPVMSCICPPSGSATGTTVVACTSTCATGMARYISVTVTMAPTQIPGLAFVTTAASRTVVARVQ